MKRAGAKLAMSASQKRAVAFRAATLDERMAGVAAQLEASAGDRPSAGALESLRRWNQAFAPGDVDAFVRRLRWDGLDWDTAARALSLAEPEWETALASDWTVWLNRVLEAAVDVASDVAQDTLIEVRDLASGDPPPFLELWVAPMRAARTVLLEQTETDALESVTLAAHRLFEQQLLKEVAAFSELAMYEQFCEFLGRALDQRPVRPTGAPASETAKRYRAFILAMLHGGLCSFFTSYPVLARQIVVVIEGWVGATAELLRRLASDRAALSASFANGADLGRVEWVEPALSDPHEGRRRVVVLGFESGVRLVYKPRDVGLEKAFNDFLEWAAARGLEPCQKRLRVLERPGYGWIEFAAHEPFQDKADVRRYFRKSGGLICLAYLLRGQDLHMENLIATRDGPALIDLELLVQPISKSSVAVEDAGIEPGGGPRVEESCLAAGLLSFIETGPEGQLYDTGALRGEGAGPAALPRRVWKGLGSDSLHFVEEATFRTRAHNSVVLSGALQKPEEFADEIVAGFEQTYRFLLANREEMLVPGGGLSLFAERWTRVIPRPSNQYVMLNYVLASPRYQRDGVARSCAMDVLNRAFSRARSRPSVWPLVAEERRTLEGLDVPHFRVRTGETMVYAGPRALFDHYFARSGLEAVAARAGALSEDDLRLQVDLVAGALAESIHTRFRSELTLSAAAQPKEAESGRRGDVALVAYASWIARELLSRAICSDQGFTWPPPRSHGHEPDGAGRHHLYGGTVGVGLFLAALAATSSERKWAEAARDAARPVRGFLDHPRIDDLLAQESIGVCSGLGSIVYALTWMGRLLDDDSLRESALRAARFITNDRIESDRRLDVVGGAAGAILALLALYHDVGDPGLLDRAIVCGEHLIATQTEVDGGSAWPVAGSRLFTGFAHGTAGIGYALLRLFKETGRRQFRDTAVRADRFERSLYSPVHGNWLIEGTAADGTGAAGVPMTAWCHGAPGIVLAKAFALDILEEAAILREIETALNTIAAAPAHQADHVCCGNLGRCEALFTVGRRLQLAAARTAAERLAARVTALAQERGHFRLSAARFEYRVFDAGFFRGLSGIGYHLLRMAAPSRVPSVLAFEATAA